MLYMLGQRELARTLLPVGELTKADVRARAAALGLRTAAKPESMDVCFITKGGRARVPRRTHRTTTRRDGRRDGRDRRGPRRHRRVHDRAAARTRRCGRRTPLCDRHRSGDRHRHHRNRATTCCAITYLDDACGRGARRRRTVLVQIARARRTRSRAGSTATGVFDAPQPSASRPARWWRATTATSCSAEGSRAGSRGRSAGQVGMRRRSAATSNTSRSTGATRTHVGTDEQRRRSGPGAGRTSPVRAAGS